MVISLKQVWVNGAENLLVALCQSQFHLAGTRGILSNAAACLTHVPQGCFLCHFPSVPCREGSHSPVLAQPKVASHNLSLSVTHPPPQAPKVCSFSSSPDTCLLADVSKKAEIFGRTSVGSNFPPELSVAILTLSQVNLYFSNDTCGRLWDCLLSVYVQLPPRK